MKYFGYDKTLKGNVSVVVETNHSEETIDNYENRWEFDGKGKIIDKRTYDLNGMEDQIYSFKYDADGLLTSREFTDKT